MEVDMNTLEINGAEIRYRELGSGEPLLLLHGMTGTGGDWVHAFDVERLAERYRVVMPDLRGHGGSTNPGGVLEQRQLARDVQELCARLDIGGFAGVGMSLGSNVLLHLALLEPERVRRLVLVAPWMRFTDAARAVIRSLEVKAPTAQDWSAMRERHTRGDDQIRALWRYACALGDDPEDTSFDAKKLETVRARTLLVNGDRDPFLPARLTLELYEALPDAALWIIPDGGHGPIYGEWRAAFERVALAFLLA
jgi:pimeloyl-ACP methyl ester carboxylesterase